MINIKFITVIYVLVQFTTSLFGQIDLDLYKYSVNLENSEIEKISFWGYVNNVGDTIKTGNCFFYTKDQKLLVKGFYSNDKANGEWLFYNESGKLIKVEYFYFGHLVGQVDYKIGKTVLIQTPMIYYIICDYKNKYILILVIVVLILVRLIINSWILNKKNNTKNSIFGFGLRNIVQFYKAFFIFWIKFRKEYRWFQIVSNLLYLLLIFIGVYILLSYSELFNGSCISNPALPR